MSETIEIVAERPVPGGRMLARHDGRVVLLAGAIPGERVRARIERVSRNTVWATVQRLEDVLEPSPDRQESGVDPACGGAVLAHIRYGRQLLLKAEIITDAFRRIGRLPLPAPPAVTGSDDRGYRMRARLHVRGGRAGFFREGTHSLCDAARTGQLLPEAIPAAARVLEALEGREHASDGLTISENAAATERVIHLDARAGATLHDAFERLAAIDLEAAGLTGLTIIDGDDLLELAGEALVRDAAATLAPGAGLPHAISWARRPTSFFQGNRHLTGGLLERVIALAEGQHCVDLYAGVGLFSVPLAASGRAVVAVESDASAFDDLALNAEPWRGALDVRRSSVEAWLSSAADAGDVCVVDPPRTGMSEAAVANLTRLKPSRLVYVSCDVATLARDAAKFVGSGYRLAAIDGFDLFPNTAHVETVVTFIADDAAAPRPAPVR